MSVAAVKQFNSWSIRKLIEYSIVNGLDNFIRHKRISQLLASMRQMLVLVQSWSIVLFREKIEHLEELFRIRKVILWCTV